MIDEPHSLDDWVAVKESPFDSDEPHKTNLRFLVNWNEHERNLVITCHESRPRNVKRTLNNSAKATGKSDSARTPEDLRSWSGIFTLQDISYAHQQLCLIKPDLENYPPDLPYEPRGFWSLLYSIEIPDHFNKSLESYLSTAEHVCGNKLLTDSLFNRDEVASEQYFENCSELRQKAYADHEASVVQRLSESLKSSADLDKMVDMLELYSNVDSILAELATARAEAFNIMLQPFLDMRELSFNRLLRLQDELGDEFMSQARRDRCLMEYSEWQEEYVAAIESINGIRVQYFARCAEATKDTISHLEDDKLKFGKSTWAVTGEGRLQDFHQMLSREKIQLLQAKQEKHKHRIEKITQEMALLGEGPHYINELESLEQLAFDLRVKLYNTQLDVLSEQDKMLRRELAAIKLQLKEAEEMDVFFDALDSLQDVDLEADGEELDAEDSGGNGKGRRSWMDPRVADIQVKLSKINRQRARIRSSKQSCISQEHSKVAEKKSDEDRFKSHHRIQLKRDQLLAEQKRRKDFIQSERKKTVDRLHNYKVSHPSPKILKPQRYKKAAKKEASTKSEAEAATEREKKQAAAARDVARRSYQPPKPTKSKTSPNVGNQPQAPPPPPPPPPPPAPPAPPPCLPPPPPAYPPPSAPGTGTKAAKTVNKDEKKDSGGGKGLDLSDILKARGNLQKRASSSSDHSVGSSQDPMVATLANIRRGVKLRNIQKDPKASASPYCSLESTELMAAINRIRNHTEIQPDSDSSDGEFSV